MIGQHFLWWELVILVVGLLYAWHVGIKEEKLIDEFDKELQRSLKRNRHLKIKLN